MLLVTLLDADGFLDAVRSFFSSAGSWAAAIGGIGLVVFVHELGHFLVAKRCGVRVETFSIGFGPRLLGFRRGDTDYRLCLVPIGGYVKMAGDAPGDSLQMDGTELPSKSVGQRFAIFSAGVAMNLVFAIVVLPIVLAIGVQFHSTRIGGVLPGGPAWRAGLERGDEVRAVSGHKVDDFQDVMAEVALSGNDAVELEVVRRAARVEGRGEVVDRVVIQSERDEKMGRFVIGIGPSYAPTFDVVPGGPAAAAGIRPQDRITRFSGKPIASVEEFETLRLENRLPRVQLGVTGPDGVERLVDVEVRPDARAIPLLGVRARVNVVKALRGAAARVADFLRPGDVVDALVRVDATGAIAARLQPIRDGDEFEAALARAESRDPSLRVELERDGSSILVPLPADAMRTLAHDVALVQDPESCVVRIMAGYPADLGGLPDGAEIRTIDNVAVQRWSEISQRIEKAAPEVHGEIVARPLQIVAVLDGREIKLNLTPRVERLPIDFGLLVSLDMVTRSYPVLEAARVGLSSAAYMLKNVYLTLKKILVHDVSASNLSGILTIASVSRSLVDYGLPTLFFFLAVLSLNLAFLNLLPIPVLDGGHLFFLIVEKLKGSPVSERALGISQLIGVVLVLALLLFVTYNDLRRFFL
jgi:regulator of sigma E protease